MSRWQDTPAGVFMRLMADLMIVNILAVVASIPIFTIGASLSAMYAVLFDREQNEGSVAVISTFFKAFQKNFGKATILELLLVVLFGVAAGDFWFAKSAQPPVQGLYQVIGTIVIVLGLILFILAFAQQSIYQNSISGYLKNSLKLALCAPGQLVVSLAAWFIPWFVAFGDVELLQYLGFFLMLWGFSFPVWVAVKLFRKVFQRAGTPQEDRSQKK